MDSYKVVIIGGGPAGTLTSLSLLQKRPELANEILLLETKSFPREKVCGGGVSGRVATYLEFLKIPLHRLPKIPMQGFTVCFEDQRYFPPFGNDKTFVTRRSALDSLLLEEAEERGVHVRTAMPAVGAYRERKGIVVLDRAGKSYSAEVLVAADGVNGRSRIWFDLPHKGRKTILLQTDFPRDPDSPVLRDRLIMDFTPPKFKVPGYVWFFPSIGDEGEPVVNAGISGGWFEPGSIATLKDIFLNILECYPEIKAMAPSDLHFKGYPERDFTLMHSTSRERILFVGEQLGVDCFTGEGLSVCADSALIAAEEIIAALDHGNFSFKGYTRRLLGASFFPVYLVGRIYMMQNNGYQPNLFFTMTTRQSPHGKRNVLEYYSHVFSGAERPETLYTPGFWGTVVRDTAAVLPAWLRGVIETSFSQR